MADSDISGSILTIGAGGVFNPQTLSAGRSIRRNAANTAFEDYAPNTGDGSALTNLNAAAIGSNTVPPARLGTGTPSSGTVLRGDGTWAGTTSTGNTIASTGNLLMGDSAGNALAVASSSDLQHVLQLRADTARALTSLPSNLLGSANLVIRNGTLNADGTLTIPANDYVQWNDAGDTATHVPRSCYAVSTTDQPVGKTGGFYINAFYNGYNNVGFNYAGEVYSQPEPGVSKYTFTNSVGNGSYAVFVTNATSSPITIYPPVMALADAGVLPVPSFADAVPVSSQPVSDLDFKRFASTDRTGRYLAEKQTTLAADSVTGNNANAGTLYAPKLTLPTTITNPGAVIGLYRGSLFRASLPLASIGNPQGIVVQDLGFGSLKTLPTISGLDPVPNSSISPVGDGTYSYVWLPAEAIVNDGYSNVYVVEINTTTEAQTPVASRHRMIDVTSQAAAASTPGSVWVQKTGPQAGAWTAILHPSDGLAPGSGAYRYEVVSRIAPAAYSSQTVGDSAIGGLELVGGSNGYGSLAGPTGFVGDRLAVLHCTTHNAVLGGGSLQRSVFYETGNLAQCIQLAWYTGNATGLRWDTRNCLFYANVGDRPANCLISHSAGPNYDRGDISDTAFIGARWSNGSLHGTAIEYDNVNTGVIERIYVQAIQDIFGFNMPVSTEVKNSVFRQVGRTRVGGNFHDNVVLAESIADPANPSNAPANILFQQSGASATNNILWARGVPGATAGNGESVSGIQFYNGSPAVANCTCQRNIIVLNAANAAASTYYNPGSSNSASMSIDYNLVINLSKAGFHAEGGAGYSTFAAYQAAYGLDQHSLYLDLSADPRGIQAVFADPINGDFRWAQTDAARRCAAYCRANNVGPATVTTRWPTVPTVDDAVRLLTDL